LNVGEGSAGFRYRIQPGDRAPGRCVLSRQALVELADDVGRGVEDSVELLSGPGDVTERARRVVDRVDNEIDRGDKSSPAWVTHCTAATCLQHAEPNWLEGQLQDQRPPAERMAR
jgi:hypothetical protein